MTSYPTLLKSQLYRDISSEDYQAYDSHFEIQKSNALRDLNQEDLLSFGNELPLHIAAISGDIEAIIKLVSDTTINLRNDKGYTALHWACIGGKFDAAEYLLKSGANVDSLTDRQESSIHWAVRSNSCDLVQLLLSTISASMIDQRNHKGFTALHFSASKGNFDIYLQLLLRRANLFVRNMYGATALHWACLSEGSTPNSDIFLGKQKIAEHLIDQLSTSEHDLSFLNCTNKIGKTALHWACLSEFDSIVRKLLDKNCDPYVSVPPYASVLDDIKNNKISPKIVAIFEERGIV